MDLKLIAPQVIAGVTIGVIYSLIALGFTIMLRATELINFAQGEMVMLGAFFGYTLLTTARLPFVGAFVLSTGLMFLLGLVVERVAIRPLVRRQDPLLNIVIATLGFFYLLRSAAINLWGADPLTYPAAVTRGSVRVAGLRLDLSHLWIIALAVVLIASLQLFFKRTLTGISWRAASLDPETAALMGVRVPRTIALTWGLSCALGGAAGVLVAPLFFVSFDMGWVAIKAFAAAAIGGFGIVGSIVGGPVLGLVETLGAGLISSGYKDVIAYGIMIFILLFFYRARAPVKRQAGERARAVTGAGELFPPGLLSRGQRTALAIGVLAVGLALPLFVHSVFGIRLLVLAFINIVAALGLQLIIGYTGQLSLAHAAFMGIGAYTSALLTLRVGLPFWPAFVAAPVVAGIMAWLVAPLLRLSGHYLAIGTLALGEIVIVLLINLKGITNGAYGLNKIPPPSVFGFVVNTPTRYYYLAGMIVILLYVTFRRLATSRFGRSLVAIRENEVAAAAAGIPVTARKIRTFVIGSSCAGIAGALYGHFMAFIDPTTFTVLQSIELLIMVVIGGLGSIPGAVLGGAMASLAPEYLRFLTTYRMGVYGIVLILFILFLPGGLTDLIRRPVEWLVRRRVRAPAPMPALGREG